MGVVARIDCCVLWTEASPASVRGSQKNLCLKPTFVLHVLKPRGIRFVTYVALRLTAYMFQYC